MGSGIFCEPCDCNKEKQQTIDVDIFQKNRRRQKDDKEEYNDQVELVIYDPYDTYKFIYSD